MKYPYRAVSLITCLGALLPSITNATPYTFDPGQIPGTPTGGTGAWDTTSAFWANGGTDSVWGNAGTDSAIFGGTAGTVTIGGTTIKATGLTFNTTGYTVTGGTLNFAGGTPTITNGASVSTTLTSILTGTNGLTLEGGTGTLTINNASNSLSGGIKLNSGKLTTSTAGSLGSNVLTLNGGTFLPRTNLTNNILVTADSRIDMSGVNSNYTLGNLSIGNQTLEILSTTSGSNGKVTFGSTTLTGDATIRTSKGSSSTTPGSSATFGAITVGDSVATGTTTTLTMNSTSSSVNRIRQMDLNGVLSDNASDATKILALNVSAGNSASLIVNVGGANTYTGGTTISGQSSFYPATGTLRLTTGNDRLPTGTILTINGGNTAAGVLDLNSFNQTVRGLNGGSGNTKGSVTNNDSGTGTATLTVSSTTTDSTFAGLITDGATAKVALTKAGAGTKLTLTGAQTYTGATTVTGGIFAIGAANIISDSSNLVLGGGTFASGGFNETLGTLSLSNNSFLDFGAGTSSLVFADSSSSIWTGTLTLLNFDIGTDSLKFGSSISGLSMAQLQSISLAGFTADIDASGFVTFTSAAIPEPSTYAALAGACVLLAGFSRRRQNRR